MDGQRRGLDIKNVADGVRVRWLLTFKSTVRGPYSVRVAKPTVYELPYWVTPFKCLLRSLHSATSSDRDRARIVMHA